MNQNRIEGALYFSIALLFLVQGVFYVKALFSAFYVLGGSVVIFFVVSGLFATFTPMKRVTTESTTDPRRLPKYEEGEVKKEVKSSQEPQKKVKRDPTRLGF